MKNDRYLAMPTINTIKRWRRPRTLRKRWSTMAVRWNEYDSLWLRQDHVKHGRLTKKHWWANGYSKQKMVTEPNPMGCHLATILLTSLQANAFNNWNNISKITHVFLDSFCIYARTGALRKARLWATNSGIEGDYQMSIDNVIRCQTEKKINGNGNGMKQHPRMGKEIIWIILPPQIRKKD